MENLKNLPKLVLECADDKHFVFVELLWIGQKSTKFGKEIQNMVCKNYLTTTPRAIFTTERAFSGRVKNVLPQQSKRSVVYEFR